MEHDKETLLVSPNTQIKSRCSWCKFGSMGWFLLLGLIILGVGILVEIDVVDKRTLNMILYRIDPRYWSFSLIPVLWGLVCWFVADFAGYFSIIRKIRVWIRLVIALAVFYGVAVLSWDWSFQKLGREFYFSIYIAYVIGPTANYMATGIWDWKMFIMPVSAFATVAFLLYITIKNRRKKYEK